MNVRRVLLYAALVGAAWVLRRGICYAALILSGGAAIALLIGPLMIRFEKRMGRPRALLCAWLTILLPLAVVLALLPGIAVSQFQSVCAAWPEICLVLGRFEPDWQAVAGQILPLFPKLRDGIGSVAAVFSALGMMVLLSVFLLMEKERYLLRAELAVPFRYRKAVLGIIRRILRELRLFLGAQAMVACCVGFLTAVGLFIIGMPGALLLGVVTGICNLVPYFGPVIAAVPVILLAITESWLRALMAGTVLVAVQQFDSYFISPRILSGVTGLSPLTVLTALAAGGACFGVPGVLLAIPFAIVIRILLSEWTKNAGLRHRQNQN